MINFIINNLLSTYKFLVCLGAMIAAFFFFKSGISNFSQNRKKHYANESSAMCIFMIIMGSVFSVLSGVLSAM